MVYKEVESEERLVTEDLEKRTYWVSVEYELYKIWVEKRGLYESGGHNDVLTAVIFEL